MAKAGNILIIDDEEIVRGLLEGILVKGGHQVSMAATGKEALEKIKNNRFDLIMVDINLPDISGIEILKQVREKDKEIEAIIITGFASYETAIDALKQGVYDYIEKPFEDINKVVMICEKALERRRLKYENRKLTEDLARINGELKKANSSLRQKMAQFTTLYQIGQLLNSAPDIEKTMDLSIGFLGEGFRVTSGAILLIDSGELVIKRGIGLSPETLKNFRIKPGEGKIGKIFKDEKRALIKDFKDDPLFQDKFAVKDKKAIDTFFATPLRAANEVIGFLTVFKLGEGSFDEETMDIFSLFASQIAPAIRLSLGESINS